MPGGKDTDYLKSTIGDALSRGCAAAVAAQPEDPVEYLALWLLSYVKNAQVAGDFYKQKSAKLEAKRKEVEASLAATTRAKEEDHKKKAALKQLAELTGEPRLIVQAALDLIKQYTAVGSAYAAAVSDPEEQDWIPPEDADIPDVESDDEVAPIAEGGADAESTQDSEQPPVLETSEQTAAEGEEAAGLPVIKAANTINYSKKYLSYIAATAGQEFILECDLSRPAPLAEDIDPDEVKPELAALTFKILDEKLPMVYSPNVAMEPQIKFFRSFPKIGSYQACGIQVSSGEFVAVLAADTLFPEGSGQPMSQQDKDFVWDVSLQLAKALEASQEASKAVIASSALSGAERVASLQQKIEVIRNPPPVIVEGQGKYANAVFPDMNTTYRKMLPLLRRTYTAIISADVSGEGEVQSQEPAPEPTPEDAALEPEPVPGGEEDAGDDGEPPADPVPGLQSAVRRLTAESKAAVNAEAAASNTLLKEQQILQAVTEVVSIVSGEALTALRNRLAVPQATFHIIKAALHMLGRDASTFKNWKQVYNHLTPKFFSDLESFDATAERDMEAWKHVRSCYKAVTSTRSLEKEMPDTYFGVLLLQLIKQIRKVSRKAAAHREAIARRDKLAADLENKKSELQAAEIAKAEAEAKAREEAEAAAAAAGADDAEQQEGQDEQADDGDE